jgi:predicted GIY-YIG superfamily endonuclease
MVMIWYIGSTKKFHKRKQEHIYKNQKRDTY